jgi:subtilisin family serine protease
MTAAFAQDAADAPPEYGIPDDLVVSNDVFGASAETWHLPRSTWRAIRNKATGRGIKVAVLDTGYTAHPSLPKPVASKSFISGQSVDDGNGHGTHCCGTVLARDEDIGVAPEAELIVGKVLSNQGSGSSSGIAAGVRWALEQGASVVSMSLGGGSSYGPTNAAIRDCLEAGVLVCIAAGNSGFSGRGNTIGWPARSGEGICVGATQQNGAIAGFSSGGEQLTVACPGQQILSCSTRGGFVMMSGTSMATPFMAGLCALVQELRMREGYAMLRGVSSVVSFLKSITEDRGAPGHDPSFGHGVPVANDLVRLLAQDSLEWL